MSKRCGISFLQWVALLLSGLLFSGCQTFRYYKQAVAGQVEVLSSKRPISELLTEPDTPTSLKERLKLVLQIREFAMKELALPPDGHYLSYADLHRRFVVWNVHAAPEFSLEPKTWWYPIVGRLKYRGYFSEPEARYYAARLEREGYDVFIGGVQAYSTLGWFHDPVLNTFIFENEPELVELLFHELAHQVVFARGDTDFNEAFATAVAEEGLRRWMRAHGDAQAIQMCEVERKRKEQFVQLVSGARERLKLLYGEADTETRDKKTFACEKCSETPKRMDKERVFAELRREYEQLKVEWEGVGKYDNWFRNSLNNAKLNTVETYYRLVPAFRELLRSHGGDLQSFYRTAKALSKLPKINRHQRLATFLENVDTQGSWTGTDVLMRNITKPE